jgi:5-methylcytosine-specific restriction endonuclease McrA
MIDNWTEINSNDFKHQYYYYDNDVLIISKINKETAELVDLIGQYSLDGKTLINTFRTQKDAAKKLECSAGDISSCIKKVKGYLSCKGYVWKKLENQPPILKTENEIIEELNRNILKGGKERHGDVYLSICHKNGKTKKVKFYRFIYYIYNQNEISGCKSCKKDPRVFCVFDSKHDIDHIDGNHSNNDPKNLQRLCHSCHSKKTNMQTREQQNITKKQNRKNKSKINVYKNGETIFKTFSSQIECKKELNIADGTIKKSIENKTYTQKLKDGNKYLFELAFEEIEGEIWKDIPVELGKGSVSNKGRIKTTSNIISYGTSKYGYLLFKRTGIHVLIAKSFLKDEYEEKALEIQQKFPDISIEEIKNSSGKKYSIMVDHIDRNPTNNCLENLRWASVEENNLNTSKNKKVEQWSLDGKILINTFQNQKDVCEKLGFKSSLISRSVTGVLKQTNGFIFKEENSNIEDIELPEEKAFKIFKPNFDKFVKFINDNKRTPFQKKDELGIWYNTMKQLYKNKTCCMSYDKIYNLYCDFKNSEENIKYFLDWNDTWLINFNKITDLFNNKLSDEIEIKKLKNWMRSQKYNYQNKVNSMSDKNKEQFDKWTELINSDKYKKYF